MTTRQNASCIALYLNHEIVFKSASVEYSKLAIDLYLSIVFFKIWLKFCQPLQHFSLIM